MPVVFFGRWGPLHSQWSEEGAKRAKRGHSPCEGACTCTCQGRWVCPVLQQQPHHGSWPHTGCCKKRGRPHAHSFWEAEFPDAVFSVFCMRQCSKQMQRFPILFNPIFCMRNCSKQMLRFPVLCNSSFLYAKVLETDLEFHTNRFGNLNICFEHFHIQTKNQRAVYGNSGFSKGVSAWAPLFTTDVWGHEGVLRLLLEHRANPNTLNEDKNRPLHVVSAPLFARLVLSPLHCEWSGPQRPKKWHTQTGSHSQMSLPNHRYRTERSGYHIIAHSWIIAHAGSSLWLVVCWSTQESSWRYYLWLKGIPLCASVCFSNIPRKNCKHTWKKQKMHKNIS